MRLKEYLHIIDLYNSAIEEQFMKDFEELRKQAKKISSNRTPYKIQQKQPRNYSLDDLFGIKRTQKVPGLKLKSKFIDYHKVTKIKFIDIFDIDKIVPTEGLVTLLSISLRLMYINFVIY